MPYLNIDDAMDEHPKIEALSAEAFHQMMCNSRKGARV